MWLRHTRNGASGQQAEGGTRTHTTFTLSDASAGGEGTERIVGVTVGNTGSRAGAEGVQVYGGLPSTRFERPARRLLGFARVELAAGETRRVEIPVSLRTLAVRRDGTWLVERGRYALAVARHAADPGALRIEVELDR